MTFINQNWLNANRKEKQSPLDHVSEYFETTDAAQVLLDLSQGSAELVSKVYAKYKPTSEIGKFATDVESKLGIANDVLGLTYFPSATVDALKSLAALRVDDGVNPCRKIKNAFKETTSAISTYGNCIMFFKDLPLARMTKFFGLMSSFMSLHITQEDYLLASHLEKSAIVDAKLAIGHTKRDRLMGLIGIIASIAGSIISISMAAIGMPFALSIALTSLSLSITILGLIKDIHKRSGEFPIINFSKSHYTQTT